MDILDWVQRVRTFVFLVKCLSRKQSLKRRLSGIAWATYPSAKVVPGSCHVDAMQWL